MTTIQPPPDDPAVAIFVSYSARTPAERALSERLVDLLSTALAIPSRAMFAYTAPGHGPTTGARLKDELKCALTDCKAFLTIVSPAASLSSYTQFEIAASDLTDKFRVPLLPGPSFQTHVPEVLREQTGRSLGSLGELCQLLDDLKAPLGLATLTPPILWITKAEDVVAAANQVARHVGPEVRRARVAAVAALVLALAAGAAAGLLWKQAADERALSAQARGELERTSTELKAMEDKAVKFEDSIKQFERRSSLRPAVKIEGVVTTSKGQRARDAIVAACAAVPRTRDNGDVCPEELRLNWVTDSDGEFVLDLGSLPPIDAKAGTSPEGIWLIAQDSSQRRVNKRLETVLRANLLLP